jgi:hypothetical protein
MGELGDHRVRLHVFGRRALHQVKGGEKHPPFGGSDVGREPRPRGDAGEMGIIYFYRERRKKRPASRK